MERLDYMACWKATQNNDMAARVNISADYCGRLSSVVFKISLIVWILSVYFRRNLRYNLHRTIQEVWTG